MAGARFGNNNWKLDQHTSVKIIIILGAGTGTQSATQQLSQAPTIHPGITLETMSTG